ncbi:MAG: malate dehydrogenase [Candidatus Woesearchaeota archaeon]
MTKITIIGVGNLGAAIANEIAARDLCNELVLVDIFKELAEGQALDIQQSLPFRNNSNRRDHNSDNSNNSDNSDNSNKTKVYSGDYELIKNSDIIVLTAGKPRTPEMKDRLELAEINFKIVGSVLDEIKKYSPNSIIITITNPMDIINHFIYKNGFVREKVIGMGGQLDSSRFRTVLGYPEKEVEAFIIGEHGANQIPVFSKIKIDGKDVAFGVEEKNKIKEEIKMSSMQVIKKKGVTVFAPASNTADMVEAIIKDQKKMMTCSINLQGEYGLENVSIGVPVKLGKNGIEEIVIWDLSEEELVGLKETADKLKEFYGKLQS